MSVLSPVEGSRTVHSLPSFKRKQPADQTVDVKPEIDKKPKIEEDAEGKVGTGASGDLSDDEVEIRDPSTGRWTPSLPNTNHLAEASRSTPSSSNRSSPAPKSRPTLSVLTNNPPTHSSSSTYTQYTPRRSTLQGGSLGASRQTSGRGGSGSGANGVAVGWRSSEHAALSNSLLSVPHFPNFLNTASRPPTGSSAIEAKRMANTPYTAEEKSLLMRLYAKATAGGGKPNWVEIATHFPNRSRHALANQLSTMRETERCQGPVELNAESSTLDTNTDSDPDSASDTDSTDDDDSDDSDSSDAEESLSRTGWSREEHDRLMRAREESKAKYGGRPNWAEIAAQFPGRTLGACQAHPGNWANSKAGQAERRRQDRAEQKKAATRSSELDRLLQDQASAGPARSTQPATGSTESSGRAWTDAEGILLVTLYDQSAKDRASWTPILARLPGRTRGACSAALFKNGPRWRRMAATQSAQPRPTRSHPPSASTTTTSARATTATRSNTERAQVLPVPAPRLKVSSTPTAVGNPAGGSGRALVAPPARLMVQAPSSSVGARARPQVQAKPWTEPEIEDLINAVGACWDPTKVTPEEWEGIGDSVGRTRFECVVQYAKLEKAGRGVGASAAAAAAWTAAESRRLIEVHNASLEELGYPYWDEIAEQMAPRSRKECEDEIKRIRTMSEAQA